MNVWQHLVDAVVRGADPVAGWTDGADPNLAALLQQIAAPGPGDRPEDAPEHRPEHSLLAAAGVLAVYRAAGRTLPRLTAGAPVESAAAPACDPAVAALLEHVLEHAHDPLLPEVLARLQAHGVIVPARLAPQLLARFANAATLRTAVSAVVGPAGRQLAAENPAWRALSDAADGWDGLAALWQTADMSGRRHLVAQVRGRDPDLGRALLEVHWRQLAAQGREPLIQALETGLSMADEPFLETVLDDRAQTVRRKAAELLARLPGSRLALRMADAAPAYLAWSPAGDAASDAAGDGTSDVASDTGTAAVPAAFIAVRPPESLPASLQRDGALAYTRGDRLRWQGAQLSYIIGGVPLRHWEETWQATPDAIVAAALAGRWPRTITTGLAQAATAQHNHAWAAAILPACNFALHVLRAVPVLTSAQLDALLDAHVPADEPLTGDALLVKLVRRRPQPWSDALAARWIHAVGLTLDATAPGAPLDRLVTTALRDFALRAPSACHAAAVARWLPSLHADQRTRAAVREALALLDLRAQLDALLPA